MLDNVLEDYGAMKKTPLEAYTDIFRLGQGRLQCKGDKEEKGVKGNPIAYCRNVADEHGKFWIMFEDDFPSLLEVIAEYDFAVLNGLTFVGRKNKAEAAVAMYAMILDLDGVTDVTLNRFLYGCCNDIYPMPSYIILSGHGIHLYYIFSEPILLYPYLKLALKNLKYALTYKVWNEYTSEDPKVQTQGIHQPFRAIGSKAKKGAPISVVTAYKMVPDRYYTIDDLNNYVDDKDKVDPTKYWHETQYTLAEAQEKYPEWYERVIIKKKTGYADIPRWDIAGKVHGDDPYALYHWWLRKISSGATYGHRYFCMMCLAIYAVKASVPEDILRNDAMGLIPIYNALKPDQPFTVTDVKDALECYDSRYCTFPIDDIVKISHIDIKKNKRNGRSQKEHLQSKYWKNDKGRPIINVCRQNRELALQYMIENGEIKGRPRGSGTAQNTVRIWRQNHPDGRKIDCHRDTGLSRPTIDKWWI